MTQTRIFLVLLAATLACSEPQTAMVYIQPIITTGAASPPPPPAPLAEIAYDISTTVTGDSPAEVTSFEAPELGEDSRLVRIGVYDEKRDEWASSTSVASVDNFGRGYSPHFVLSVAGDGGGGARYIGVSCRGVRVDAGATRDFGPQAVVVVSEPGKQPALNKPIILSAEGKQVPPEEEKSFLQKYWWLIGIVVFMLVTSGGPETA